MGPKWGQPGGSSSPARPVTGFRPSLTSIKTPMYVPTPPEKRKVACSDSQGGRRRGQHCRSHPPQRSPREAEQRGELVWAARELGNTHIDRCPRVITDFRNTLVVHSDSTERPVPERKSLLANLGQRAAAPPRTVPVRRGLLPLRNQSGARKTSSPKAINSATCASYSTRSGFIFSSILSQSHL